MTIGADPEIILVDNVGIPVSAVGKVGGTKARPLKVEKGAFQEDNVLAEINISPAHSKAQFVDNISTVLEQLAAKVAPLKLRFDASALYPASELTHYKARTFGCEADLNAWEMCENIPPNPHQAGNLRTAGGHIHVSVTNPSSPLEGVNMIRYLDIVVGIPSVILDPDTTRRSLYGKAGAFRPKPYGVEYRTPSNFWLRSTSLMEWVYNTTAQAQIYAASWLDSRFLNHGLYPEDIQQCINSADVNMAKDICRTYEIAYPTGEVK